MQRKLAAILAADVVGYSRMLEADEAATLAALKDRRKRVLEPLVLKHHGRIVKLMGDGVLIEFGSAVEAVQCAVALQGAMREANEGLPTERAILLRVGVNLGDVVVEGSDLFGDGVNVAARLEGIAEPGGICVSAPVRNEVHGRLSIDFDDAGEVTLNNLSRPVHVFRVKTSEVSGLADTTSRGEATKPSIAILPFLNMSGDPEQEYFSDGITEDIITELSRFNSLFVIARNSSFTLKGKAVNVTEVGRKLNARYVVEGSVRKAGNRIRITAQLIEATTGNHLWAERYDRELQDVFSVQDEVVSAIAGAITGRLDRLAVENIRRKPPSNLTAYDCELRGRWALSHWNEGLATALEWYDKAIQADPQYALAHAGMAMAYSYGLYVLGLPPEMALARAKEHARTATALDDRDPTVQAYVALTYFFSGEHRLERIHAARAVSLNPNDPFTLFVQANVLTYTGEPEQAIEWFAKSERIEPYARDDQRLDVLCDCHYMLRQYEKVVEIHTGYQNCPAFLYLVLAAAYAQMGQTDKAKIAVEEYERLRPPEHDPAVMIKYQMRMCSRQTDIDHWLEGYRKAGIAV